MEPTTTKVTDAEMKAEGATVKVGISQLQNKTPDFISKIANGVIFAGMVWGLVSMSITSIDPAMKASINEWVLLSGGIIKLASKFFGFQLPNQS
jgi:hypothetical protein